MSSLRPKRSRKIVNYGDHLHWVEESQLQKALLRSLNDRSSPQKRKYQDEEVDNDAENLSSKSPKPKRRPQPKFEYNSSSSDEDSDHSDANSGPPEVSCELRLTRLQTKLLEAAGMLEPTTDFPGTSKEDNEDQVFSEKEEMKQDHVESSEDSADSDYSDVEENASLSRLRAQRKFAANASPPSSRSNSPVKMHRQKAHRLSPAKRRAYSKEMHSPHERALRASTSSTSDLPEMSIPDPKDVRKRRKPTSSSKNKGNQSYPASSLFKSIPKTDTFLDYLCFRNTTVKVELKDCMKNETVI